MSLVMNIGEAIMKITKARLKTIIMEEIQNIKSEGYIIIPKELQDVINGWPHKYEAFYKINYDKNDIKYFQQKLNKQGYDYQVGLSSTHPNAVSFSKDGKEYYWNQSDGVWGIV